MNRNPFQHIADLPLPAFHDQRPVRNDMLHVFFLTVTISPGNNGKHLRSCGKYSFIFQWTFAHAIVACWGVSWIELTVQVFTERLTIADVFSDCQRQHRLLLLQIYDFVRQLPHVLCVSNWNSETIPKLCRSVLKSWSMKNSVTSPWDLESQPIPWQTAVNPSSKTSFSAQMFWARSSTSCSRRLYGYAFAGIFSCCCTKQCFEFLEQPSWTNSCLMHLASQVELCYYFSKTVLSKYGLWSTPALKRRHILLSHPCAEVIHTERCMAKVQWERCDFVHGVTNTNTAARRIALQRKLPMLQHYGAGMSNEDKKAVIFFSIAWIKALSQSLVELYRVRVLLDLLWDITVDVPLPQHWKKIFWRKSTLFSVEWKVIAGQDLPLWGNALRKIPSTLQHLSTEEQRPQQVVACFYSPCNATIHHIFPWASPQWIWNVCASAGKRTFFPQDRGKVNTDQ